MCSAAETADTQGGERKKGGMDDGQPLTPEQYSWLAREGIQLMLNNHFAEAEHMFASHTEDSLQMAVGYCYLTFMNAVMSFEEDKVRHSLETLRSLERRCGSGEPGWFSSVKNIVLGSRTTQIQNDDLGPQLEQQVILADCHVLLAILTFLQQEIGAYVKGGWVLRKAWKVYEHAYVKVKRMYLAAFGENSGIPASPNGIVPGSLLHCGVEEPLSPGSWSVASADGSHMPQSAHESSLPYPSVDPLIPTVFSDQSSSTSVDNSSSFDSSSSNLSPHPDSRASASSPSSTASYTGMGSSLLTSAQRIRIPLSKSVPNLRGILYPNHKQSSKKTLPHDVISRLMASVSFGYGLFQLCMSLLPPSLLKLVHLLGLPGDRLAGLSALMFARKSDDMRAPLATLTLLWYHTIVRPFFALDGSKVKAGLEAARLLLQEAQQEYAHSALFLFFHGRVNRLQGDISGALVAYRGALQASQQRELQLLSLHEIAWCHVLQLSWCHAQGAFSSLKRESRWSKSFYAYLSAVCLGAMGRHEDCVRGMAEVPDLVRRSNHALENFLIVRARKTTKRTITKNLCQLRVYELLYMWNALSSCSLQHRMLILEECQQMESCSELDGLRHLIMAAVLITLGSGDEAVAHLRQSAELGLRNPDELCVPAFASYELGLLLSADTETQEEGKKWLESARDDYHNYDFENRLNVRIHAALKTLSEAFQ